MRSLGGCYSCWCDCHWWKSHTSLDFILGVDPSLYFHCRLELLSHTYCGWPSQKKWLWWAGSYDFAAGLPSSWPHWGRSPHLNNILTKVNKYCLQPLTFSFSLSSGSALSTDTNFRLRFPISILETMNWIRSLQKHGPHLQQYLRSILPVASCSCSNPEGVVPFFLSLTSGCNLVLLNSKDPTVLLASVQRTSPFIIESLMNDLVRQ